MNLTRLESTVFSLKRLYPLSLLGVSKVEKIIGSQKKIWPEEILDQNEILGPQNFLC